MLENVTINIVSNVFHVYYLKMFSNIENHIKSMLIKLMRSAEIEDKNVKLHLSLHNRNFPSQIFDKKNFEIYNGKISFRSVQKVQKCL